MSTMVLRPSIRAAFGALIDYAGLFPPAELSLEQAATEYAAARAGPHAWMLGRFILPVTQLAAAPRINGPLSIIVDPNVDALKTVSEARQNGVKVEALEIPLAKSISARRECLSADEILDAAGALEADLSIQSLRDLPAFLEVPRTPPWWGVLDETLAILSRLGLQAKVRCGGVAAEAFPSVEELARFIASACASRVPFKATAGLHHPVRRRDDATGFMMHGFLNVIAAAALAPQNDASTMQAVLAEEEATAFRFDDESFWWRDRQITLDALQRTRKRFVGYGSCSFSEPIEDLTVLGMFSTQ